jgi:Na+-transporting methylmalonyl-CoA/oxaloacetate decarboxylase gamma subunit
MQPISLLSSTSVVDALPHFAGMLMVMITLSILWGVCAATAKLVRILTGSAGSSVPPPAKPERCETRPEPRAEHIAPELVAVIAAAVSVTLGRKVHIVSIKPASTQWERAGRHSVLTSHRIR